MMCSFSLSDCGVKALILLLAVVSVAAGGWFMRKPKSVIKRQTSFYKLLNWRLEPIDMQKEIQNTKFMGFLAVACGGLTIGVMIMRAWSACPK